MAEGKRTGRARLPKRIDIVKIDLGAVKEKAAELRGVLNSPHTDDQLREVLNGLDAAIVSCESVS